MKKKFIRWRNQRSQKPLILIVNNGPNEQNYDLDMEITKYKELGIINEFRTIIHFLNIELGIVWKIFNRLTID